MDPVKAKANYTRVCQLLIDKGGDALRAALHVMHPASTLSTVLNANKPTLKKIRYSVINVLQWNLLFPASGTPDSKNFDVTLLTILLRNICGLHPPAAGWNVMPPRSDTSISANITRIKIFRNEVYGHRPSAQLDDTAFETLWQEISNPLVKLGIPQQDIDELKEAPLSPEEESYVEKLKEWKELEDELLSKLNDLERGIVNVENAMFELRRIVENPVPSLVDQLARFEFTGKIDGLCKKFQDGTRQWFFEKLSSWFNDKESRVMILTAGPGVGKSVLSAKICDRYKNSGQLAAYHFCDFRNSDSRNPKRVLQSLASQMCENVEGFRDKLSEVLRRDHSQDSIPDAFRVFLNDPLHALKNHEPMVIVFDALDESKSDDKSEFLELISDKFPELPAWIKIFISSRPELQVRKKLRRLNPLEIFPDDYNHNLDLQQFMLHCLPSLNKYVERPLLWDLFPEIFGGPLGCSSSYLRSLVSKCEGSFLYAYYLVSELKEMDLGIEPNLSDYIPKGISGFYEKQFKRLKTDLQRFKPHTWSSILKCFVNVVAAAKEPLPIKILCACMGLSCEEYEVRETIFGFMSEILPVYNGCLTVYHKSLSDWLMLDGYDEHAFVADVRDGIERLWPACEKEYKDIASLRSVSDLQLSPEKTFALKIGGKLLLDVGNKKDFHWLVNVRLNFLKLQIHGELGVDIFRIIRFFNTTLPDHHFWGNIHLCAFSTITEHYKSENIFLPYVENRKLYYVYLQSLADGYFDFIQNSINCKNEARDILDATNESWIEDIEKQYNPSIKIINHAVMGGHDEFMKLGGTVALSPDNKLLVYKHKQEVEVFKFPSLLLFFDLETRKSDYSLFVIFAPDSSYFLWNSVRTCVSITEKKEISFIAHGPENIYSCSFSSCGMKLVTSEKGFIKVWDVKKKCLLVEIESDVDASVEYCSLDNSFVFLRPLSIFKEFDFNDIALLESTTLKEIDIQRMHCLRPCLTNEESYQIISPGFSSFVGSSAKFRICHYHLPTGKIVLIANNYCSKPFTWKDRQCVIFSISNFWPLVVYDFINQEVVTFFETRCLPIKSCIAWISNLDEEHFLISLRDQVFVVSFEPSGSCFFNSGRLKCCALSPDNFHVAYCYEKCILTIRSVDNGQTVQTVVLEKQPAACWWSESYLWIVCESKVVKYPRDLTQNKIVGSCVEECALNFKSVLKFAEAVLVIQPNDKGEMSILKICDNKLYPQKIPDSNFTATSVAISLDGCAVLLYSKSNSDYQLWEMGYENGWEICARGKLDDSVAWFCLTGTKNSRSSLWVTFIGGCIEDRNEPLSIYSIDFPNGEHWEHELCVPFMSSRVIYGDSKILILHNREWIHFINSSNGAIINSFYLVDFQHFVVFSSLPSFYIASRSILILTGPTHVKVFKFHNFENCLPYLTNE